MLRLSAVRAGQVVGAIQLAMRELVPTPRRTNRAEMATRVSALATAQHRLSAGAAFAAERGRAVSEQLADDDPLDPALGAADWRADYRELVVLGQLLDVPKFFARCWADQFQLQGIGLPVWTPVQEHTLAPPDEGQPVLHLQMKETTMPRWQLGRIDLAARLRKGIVTAYGTSRTALRTVVATFPCRPWLYHRLDWT